MIISDNHVLKISALIALLNVTLFIYLIKILSDIAIRKKCIIKEE